jgi:hypothetical protein
MRALPLLVLFLLSACAPTLDELFIKANISGDWTAVNTRLEAEGPPASCRDGSVLLCRSSHVESCTCAPELHYDDRHRERFTHRSNNHRY